MGGPAPLKPDSLRPAFFLRGFIGGCGSLGLSEACILEASLLEASFFSPRLRRLPLPLLPPLPLPLPLPLSLLP